MICSSEIRLAPSVAAMNAFIEPCREWIESVMGCARSDSVTLEVEVPFGHLVAEEILKGVSLESSMPGGSGCTSSARTAMGIAAERKPTNRGHLFVRPKFAVIWGEPQEVKIRFSRKQAPYVQERTWHPSQKIEKRPDGSVDLIMQVGNLWEIKRWLIVWGADARVLQPKELAKEIENECARLLRVAKKR